MSMQRKHIVNHYLAAAGIALILSACSSDERQSTGSLSIGVTDVPVIEDVDVCIHFTGITLHHSDGELIEIPYDASTYDDDAHCIDNLVGSGTNAVALNTLQGELFVQLMESEQVKSGRYNWIRLEVVEALSYVMDAEGQKDLSCPSCEAEESGLKLNRGIVVPEGGEADYMIDIDLANSLNRGPSGNYILRPTLRLVELAESGKITGTVQATLIPRMISETDTGCKVYVYERHGAVPDDYHDTDNVLTSAKVLYDAASMSYEYVAAYLPTDSAAGPTPYTVALSCNADDMDVDQNNNPSSLSGTDDDVIFTDGVADGIGQDADVIINQNTRVHFPPSED